VTAREAVGHSTWGKRDLQVLERFGARFSPAGVGVEREVRPGQAFARAAGVGVVRVLLRRRHPFSPSS